VITNTLPHNSRYVAPGNFEESQAPPIGQEYLFPKTPAIWRNGNVEQEQSFFLITLVITMVADGQQSSLPSPSRIERALYRKESAPESERSFLWSRAIGSLIKALGLHSSIGPATATRAIHCVLR
jgi:hypothetical protein